MTGSLLCPGEANKKGKRNLREAQQGRIHIDVLGEIVRTAE
jgi:hypothetical protein